MHRSIHIRNVPDDIHRRLKARAAGAGMSLPAYLRAEIAKIAALPTPEEMRRRLAALEPVSVPVDPAEAIRAERGPLTTSRGDKR